MRILILGAASSFTAAASHATIAVSGLHGTGTLHTTAAYAAASAASPVFATLLVAGLLAVWGVYALAAAGRIAPLPLMREAIWGITALYLVRGMFLLPQLLGYNVFTAGHPVSAADLACSTGVLIIALVHVAGLAQSEA